MIKYYCECCQYSTNRKQNYDRHLHSNRHLKMYPNVSKMYPNVSKMYPNVSKCIQNEQSDEKIIERKRFICKYCNKSFKYSQGLSKHIKYTCKKNDDEDLKELVRLLNEQNKQQNEKINTLQKKINKLSNKLKITSNNVIHSTNNNNYGIINNNNIVLNNYNDTDFSHLTDTDYVSIIKQINYGIPKMIEKIHFNPNKPENMNVYISNMKNKFIMMYKDGSWQLQDRNKEVDKMFDKNFYQLQDWLNENNKYDFLRKQFKRLENNIEHKEVEQMIKDEMKLILYNNRGLLQENNDECDIIEE